MPDIEPVAVPDNILDDEEWSPPGYTPPEDGANEEPVSSVHSHGDSEPVDEETS